MKRIVKALLCENEILEQLMAIPVSEIISYRNRAESVDPEEALRYLAELYIDSCGVSTGLRSFADYCSVFWIKRFKNELTGEKASKFRDLDTLPELLPFISENYTKKIDDYNISYMSDVDLRNILIEELNEATDERTKIILCAGICDFLSKISDDSWLNYYKLDRIEEAIVYLNNPTLIHHRQYKDIKKYIQWTPITDYSLYPERLRKVMEMPPHLFTDEEVQHFRLLNQRLVELQHEVMENVREITLNLQDQIVKGYHQYDSFNVEGLIYIEDVKDDADRLINTLAQHAKYVVMTTNDNSTPENMDKYIAEDIHWYGNWSGIFHQLESNHGLKICRAFRYLFEDAEVFTIADIMKVTPQMIYSQIKIHI